MRLVQVPVHQAGFWSMPGMAATTQAFIPTSSPHREMMVVILATMKAHQKRKGSWERKWGEMEGKSLRLHPCHLRDKEK